MSNSPLVQYTRLSPNCNKPRNNKIKKITIHHTAGVLSVETLGNIFAPSSRQASSNYGIGSDGRIGMYVEEKNRAWTSSNATNDNQAITIEVSNSSNGGNWPVSDHVLNRLIELCVDICKRNGIKELNYTGDKNGNLTRHNMFANTTCPGPYLQSKFPYIASEVNKRLIANENTPIEKPKTYIVKKGDTLSKIASMFGTTYQELARINNISNPSLITVGQVIKLVEEVKPKEPIVETPKEPIIEPVEEPAEEHEEIPKEEPIVEEDKLVEVVEPKTNWFVEFIKSIIQFIQSFMRGEKK